MALTRATDKIIANADGNLNLSGIVTAANFVGGGAGLTGLNVDASALKSGSDIKAQANPHGVVVTGVLTATSYSGDGSNLTNLPAGLGTALSSDQTSPLNKLYYTNEILSIGSTVTVDHPVTGTGAYTQYADIRLEEDADLIIEDGDDVIPDILGLGTDGSGLGAGGSGRIRVDSITNKNANGAPNFTNGVTVTGIATATNVSVAQSVTAVTFHGSGANLTGIDASSIKNGNDVKVQANASGATVTGVLTAVAGNPTEGSFISGNAVGVGTTTLAGRNAGVGTVPGTLVFNASSGILQVYVNDLETWQDVSSAGGYSFQATGGTKSTTSRSGFAVHTFTGPGTFTVLSNTVTGGEYLLVGGGGGGGRGGLGGTGHEVGGGGAGGHRSFGGQTFTPGSYTVVVGSGGPGGGTGDGQASSAFGQSAAGGGGGSGHTYGGRNGRPGGSGGGGGHPHTSGGSGNQPPVSPSQGSSGGSGGQSTGGGGGGASTGGDGGQYQTHAGGNGGQGTSNSITGSSVQRSGGGGGGHHLVGRRPGGGGGGGGPGGSTHMTPNGGGPQGSGDPGTTNTGGGGGGSGQGSVDGGNGGSGIVIIAYPTS